jgi:hypothetical protein
MSANVSIDTATEDRLRIELRQNVGEVAQFGTFVMVVIGAVYALMAAVRSSPGWLLGVLALAVVWSVIALTAREVYMIDGVAGTIDATRSSLLGQRHQALATSRVAAVRLCIGGTDDNRRLVELVDGAGVTLVRLPRRLTTLSDATQSELGHAIASCLGVPLRDETPNKARVLRLSR